MRSRSDNIQQRLAEILDDDPYDPDDPPECWRAHAEALARAVVSELGLHGEMSRANSHAWFRKGPYVRHFVSRWELAE